MEGAYMQCRKCQFENPEGVKFCVECGKKIELICPECGFPSSPNFKFCGECGHHFIVSSKRPSNELSFDEKIDKIQKYLPKGLTEKILAQRDRIEGERKQVTVMFCDMKGFSPLSELLGIEEAYSLMDQVYEILIHKVHDYEGTVNEMTGDGIMALFGAPVALEDAPQRAIRSSLAIHREMAKFSDQLRQEKKDIPPVKMRIGIHTGPVVVGTLGNDLRVEFKAVGDTVNLASRMEGQAQPGTTYVTENTFNLTEGFFRFEAQGKKEVKGKIEPVKVYRVIAPSTRRTRFDVSAERGLTPFVGRERELDLLLDGFGRAKAGRGQAFSVIAEAGVGKSRLLYEFRKTVANEDHTFLEGKCLSYSRGVAYHPIKDLLKSNFDVRENDRDSEIRQKVKRQLKVLGTDEASTLPYLLELLSVKNSGIDEIPMSPEVKKDRIMEAVKRITLKGSEIRPLILAVEDLHWIDGSSENYLKNLLDSISGAMVFLLFTYRPEFVHTWGGKSYHSHVNLNRLANRESLLMVSHHLGTDDINRDLEDLILEKTEGVPFFIEEFIRSLKELRIVGRRNNKYHLTKNIQEVAIPSTIQDVIMARVDTLPEGAKDLLQTGSVIEREFSYELIKRVTGLPEQELLSRLSTSKDSELLYERGVYPQATYIFKHALTREVVYNSILLKKRKEIHEKIAKSIEGLYMERLEEFYEMLAYHYSKSEIMEKAISYWHLAGRRALKLYAMNEALDHFTRCMQIIEELPAGNAKRDLQIEIGTKLGFTYLMKNKYARATKTVRPLEKLATEKRHLKSLGRIYTSIGMNLVMNKLDIENGMRYLEKSITLSKKTNDMPALSFGTTYLAGSYIYYGKFDEAEALYDQIIPLLEEKQSWYTLTVPYMSLSHIFCEKADAESAEKWSRKAYKCIEKLDDPFTQSWGNLAMGHFFLQKGNLDEAEKKLIQALDNAKKISLHVVIEPCLVYLGELYIKKEDNDSGLKHINELKDMIEHKKSPLLYLCNCLVIEAMIYMHMSKYDKALDCLERGLKFKVRICEGNLYRIFGDYYRELGTDYFQSSQEWYEKAIQIDDMIGRNLELARDYFSYGEMLKRQCKQVEASKLFNDALAIFNAFGAAWDIDQVEAAIKDA
jgi:predicted ATPase/class 3 adenylate cyclase